jgi:hypothetical protein
LKPKWDVKELQEVVRGMPLTDRQTFSQLARNLLVPRSTVQRLFKSGHFRLHTSALKPFLTEENKVSRVAYALEEIDGATLGAAAADGVVRFKDTIGHFAPSQRTSINRPAGTPVWQDENITQAKNRELLLQKVFPAIMNKWPRGEWARPNVIIRFQQDGAPSQHINPQDPVLLQGLQQLGINKVLLHTQPSSSPGTNINDLGFFCALQSEYYKMTPGNAG